MGSYASAVALTPIQLTPGTTKSVATMTAVDGTDGNKFSARNGTQLRVKNASGSQITVTVHTNFTKAGLALPNLTFTVPLTTGDVVFQFDNSVEIFWQSRSSKQVWVEFSSPTSVTAQVIQP